MPIPSRTPARTVRRAAVVRRKFSPASERLEDRALMSGPGSLDTTFGIGGLALADFTTGSDAATCLAVQADGKAVAAGQLNNQMGFAAARFNADGSPDNSFDAGGKVHATFAGTTRAQADGVVVQPDGKPVLAGWDQRTVVITSGKNQGTYFYHDYALARYTAGGALDPTFGRGGKVTTSFGSTHSGSANAVVLQGDGKIVVAGDSNATDHTTFTLVRYNPDGSLDSTFGGGIATASRYNVSLSLAIQPGTGRILLAGRNNGNGGQFAVTAFVGGGTATLPNASRTFGASIPTPPALMIAYDPPQGPRATGPAHAVPGLRIDGLLGYGRSSKVLARDRIRDALSEKH